MSHIYPVTIYLSHVLIQRRTTRQSRRAIIYVSRGPFPPESTPRGHRAFHDRNFRAVVSFRISRIATSQISPGRIPCQSEHRRPTCCSSTPLSVVVSHVRDRVSEFLSLPLSLLLLLRLLPSSLSRSSQVAVSFRPLSFFPRRLLSSFSRLPRATECPSSATCLRSMFPWWHGGLKRRTLLLRSDAASSSRSRWAPSRSRLLVSSGAPRLLFLSAELVGALLRFSTFVLSSSLIRSFFPSIPLVSDSLPFRHRRRRRRFLGALAAASSTVYWYLDPRPPVLEERGHGISSWKCGKNRRVQRLPGLQWADTVEAWKNNRIYRYLYFYR